MPSELLRTAEVKKALSGGEERSEGPPLQNINKFKMLKLPSPS